MTLENDLLDIRDRLRKGEFINEAAVKQGVVLRILQGLGWPAWDPKAVSPEYTVGTRRVDYALCLPPAGKPLVFVEVKAVGLAEGAERQLFEYAFERGVPIAILTDGQEWNFFLPAEPGLFHERRVYRLDLLEREVQECGDRLSRYLAYDAVRCGAALKTLRDEYQDVARKRTVEDTLPKAWRKLIEEQDSLLLELLADKVSTLCGFIPELDVVEQFFSNLPSDLDVVQKDATSTGSVSRRSPTTKEPTHPARYGYSLQGASVSANNAIDIVRRLLDDLARRDATFMNRYAVRTKKKKRCFVALDRQSLYQARHLCEECARKLDCGWWMGTNYSRANIRQFIELAAEVAGLQIDRDLVFSLG